MTACEFSLELVDYLKGEMDAAEAQRVEEHLERCEACRHELASLKQTLNALHKDLVPIELSAHFRLALARRLDEALNAQRCGAPRGEKVSSRSQRSRAPRLLGRVAAQARRSPYFALSLLAHAALIIIAAAIFVTISRARSSAVSPVPPAAATAANTQEENTAALAAAYQMRAQAPRVEVALEQTPQGEMRVNLAALLLQADEILLLEGDPLLRCLRGYRADRQKLEEMRTRHRDSVVCTLAEGYLALPANLAAAYLGAEKRLLAISLETTEADCIEIWTAAAWRDLERRFGSIAKAKPCLAHLAHLQRDRRIWQFCEELALIRPRGQRVLATHISPPSSL